MARPTWGVMAALVICGIVVAWSGVGAATTVVSFLVHDPPPGTPGVRSDGLGSYADYRIPPNSAVNWCVDAAPYSQGLLFVRLNRKLDGDAGVLRCSENPYPPANNPAVLGTPRNFTLTINVKAACNQLAEPAAQLPVTDGAGQPWAYAAQPELSPSPVPCALATNDNPRIRLDTLYKARARTTTIDFLLGAVGTPPAVSYEIQSDGGASIDSSLGPNVKVVAYNSTYRLARFEVGSKAKFVSPIFTMPVQITFTTTTAP